MRKVVRSTHPAPRSGGTPPSEGTASRNGARFMRLRLAGGSRPLRRRGGSDS